MTGSPSCQEQGDSVQQLFGAGVPLPTHPHEQSRSKTTGRAVVGVKEEEQVPGVSPPLREAVAA